MKGLHWTGVACAVLGAGVFAAQALQPAPQAFPIQSTVTIPFELVNRHIVLKVSVNQSRALSFILDTGDKFAVIDLARAKELGIALQGSVTVNGVGPLVTTGAFAKGAAFTLEALKGFTQPVTLAIPLESLGPRIGRDCDGLLGADFIEQFVVEVDYDARVIRLHDSQSFAYAGNGESLPIQLRHGHPIIDAAVTPVGAAPLAGRFTLDIGAVGLTLHSPFAAAHELPGHSLPTVPAAGGGGTGGAAAGRIGRVAEFRIGRFALPDPLVLFSEDRTGNFAESAIQGNIGEDILGRFRLFLDYGRSRVIFERAAHFGDAFGQAYTGLVIEAERPDYRTFRVMTVLPDSPGLRAGLVAQDVITALDGRSAADLTLTDVLQTLQRPAAHDVTVRRAQGVVRVTLIPQVIAAR